MQPIEYLLTRRSVSVKELVSPAPEGVALETILCAATRVPDHGKLCPWRLVVLREEGVRTLGDVAATTFARTYPDATSAQCEFERQRFARAPLVIAVLCTPKESIKAPAWEQELSAGAVCMNILHAAYMLGFGAKWLTEWVAYDPAILQALGGGTKDRVAGFIYLGTRTTEPEDRERPALIEVVREW